MLGVRRVLFLRGDPPQYGEPCGSSIPPEEAIEIARRDNRLNSMQKGLILSLRYPVDKVIQRVERANPDFVLTMNNDLKKLEKLRNHYNGIIVMYTVIKTSRNASYVEKELGDKDAVYAKNLADHVERVKDFVDELLLTAPRAIEDVVEVLRHSGPHLTPPRRG